MRDVILRKRNTTYPTPVNGFREVQGRASVLAFFLGMAMIATSILVGRSPTLYLLFLALSLLMTLLWRNAYHPLVFLTSISAAIPIPLFRQQIACNLIFAFWFAVLNMKHISRLPKWTYVPASLAVIGIVFSSINWMSSNVVQSIVRQGAFAYNFFLAPFLFLPLFYLRMRESRDHAANLWGLLFCLIVPSTLILISAKLFGSISNEWEASLHEAASPEGYLIYQLGRVSVNFVRTDVGFILAALICASTAVTLSQVKGLYRLLGGMCFAANLFLLLATGSFGSMFACLCGLAAIFYTQFRIVGVIKVLLSVAVICSMLLVTYSLSPPATKVYLTKRYEFRVVEADTDRLTLWTRGLAYLLEHPEGVGLTLRVGDRVKFNPHNDYLTYAISYGFIGGLAYPILVVALLISFFRVPKSTIGDPNMRAIHLAGLSVAVAIAVNSMTDHSNVNRWYFNIIWSLIWYSYFCTCWTQTEHVRYGIRHETEILRTATSQEQSL